MTRRSALAEGPSGRCVAHDVLVTFVLWTIGGFLLWAVLSLPLALAVGRLLARGSALPAPALPAESMRLRPVAVAR